MSSIDSIDHEIVRSLSKLNIKQKKTLLSLAKAFLEDKQDWWNEIGKEQQISIDKSLSEMKAGKVTRHDEVMLKYKK
jgi:predicted transcriptional regulator